MHLHEEPDVCQSCKTSISDRTNTNEISETTKQQRETKGNSGIKLFLPWRVHWKQKMAGTAYYCCLVIWECRCLLGEFTAANWMCRESTVKHKVELTVVVPSWISWWSYTVHVIYIIQFTLPFPGTVYLLQTETWHLASIKYKIVIEIILLFTSEYILSFKSQPV